MIWKADLSDADSATPLSPLLMTFSLGYSLFYSNSLYFYFCCSDVLIFNFNNCKIKIKILSFSSAQWLLWAWTISEVMNLVGKRLNIVLTTFLKNQSVPRGIQYLIAWIFVFFFSFLFCRLLIGSNWVAISFSACAGYVLWHFLIN